MNNEFNKKDIIIYSLIFILIIILIMIYIHNTKQIKKIEKYKLNDNLTIEQKLWICNNLYYDYNIYTKECDNYILNWGKYDNNC